MSFDDSDLAFVIAFSDRGDERRRTIFEWNVRRLKSFYPEAQIVVGTEDEKTGLFNLSQSRNNGIRHVDRPILFSLDADTVWNKNTLEASVAEIQQGNWVIPYKSYLNTDMDSGIRITDADPTIELIESDYTYYAVTPFVPPPNYAPVSGIVGMTTEQMFEIGGFDERCIGWGWDDRIFAYAAEQVLGKPPVRLDHSVFHIWHEVGPTVTQPKYHQNWNLFRQYESNFEAIHRKFL